MKIVTTCKNCSKKQYRYCRKRNVAKNSNICGLVQRNKFVEAEKKLA
jgi:hypothetical protein